jgi:hypothetical protein
VTFQAVFSNAGLGHDVALDLLETNPFVWEFDRELAVFREGVLQAGFGDGRCGPG